MRISVPVNHNFYEEAPIYESELSKKFTVEKVGDKKYLQQLFSSVYELKLGAEQLKQIRIFNFKRRRLFDPDEERLILKLYSKVVWAEANGAIPLGAQIHHINHIKGDDRLENLIALTPKQHRQHHAQETKSVTCSHCQIAFEASVAATTIKYCKPCRWKVGESKRKLIVRECKHCGSAFATRYGWYCSQRCVNLGARWAGIQSNG